MELPIGHFSALHQLFMQFAKLQRPDHVGRLVKRAIASHDTSANFCTGVIGLVTHAINQVLNAFLSRHFTGMVAEREHDSCTTVLPPEEHANPVLVGLGETEVPEQHLPVHCPAFQPERCTKGLAIRLVPLVHEVLKVMTGDQFMVHRCPGEVGVVPPHAHHLVHVGHFAFWIGNQDGVAAEKAFATSVIYGLAELAAAMLALLIGAAVPVLFRFFPTQSPSGHQ